MFKSVNFERAVLVLLVGVVGFLLGRSALPGQGGGLTAPEKPLFADSTVNGNNSMIAVAAPYMNGVSLLYLIDTRTKQLAIYEARGGSKSSSRVNFVAARRVDLDLRLEGYHDDSEYSFGDLAAQFRRSGWNDIRPSGNAEPGAVEGSADNKDKEKDKEKSPQTESGKKDGG
jgi:hypothetical protein